MSDTMNETGPADDPIEETADLPAETPDPYWDEEGGAPTEATQVEVDDRRVDIHITASPDSDVRLNLYAREIVGCMYREQLEVQMTDEQWYPMTASVRKTNPDRPIRIAQVVVSSLVLQSGAVLAVHTAFGSQETFDAWVANGYADPEPEDASTFADMIDEDTDS